MKRKTYPVVGAALGILGFWLAIGVAVALWTDQDGELGGPKLALFLPGTDGDVALATLASADVLPLRPAIGRWMWVVRGADEPARARLSSLGVLVTPLPPMGVVPAGCAGLGRLPRRPNP